MSDGEDSEYRFERKYHIREVPTWEVEHWVRRCPALFYEVYAPRYINNIYLDSPDLVSYFENVDGMADRTKMRIRWYGPLFGTAARPVLEFKIKRGSVGTKVSHPLKPISIAPGLGVDSVRKVLDDSDLPESVRFHLDGLHPALINRYHRKYFLSADGRYRITIDDELEFFRVHRFDNRFLSRLELTDSTVMELKYSGDIADIDDRITNYFPFRVTRMSKYVTGIDGVEA
ncbi:MAG: polyphosphate polymerase domain-containing protein [Verrucomicrobiales bacterium]|nr:polyphosphate polymerase domain-containing protein [Verrucomicrobiales bacterium]